MIIIAFIIGCLFGLYIVHRMNTQINRSIEFVQENDDGTEGNIQTIELVQENDDGIEGNIQIGTINWKEEE